MIEKLLETARSKHARWGVFGVAVGISVGIIVGISLSSQSVANQTDSYENAKVAAGKLGWDILDRLTTSSELVNRYDELDRLNLQLSELVAQSIDNTNNNSAQTESTPKVEKLPDFGSAVTSSMNPTTKTDTDTKNDETSTPTTTKYKDGVGPKDIHQASLEEIDAIPYVKPQAAKEIFNYLQNNRINSFDELITLDGVGEKTIERLRERYHIK
ncbi:MAG TPA: helix-hairpin-helix domain-containing protein [Caldisericia bacterium]|nr:helix-hairpin-helix domain-containing protein [Caldisericia bacterium]HPF49115.1 helix-hairpin-helix domain-containing protein [Caldisericia bacterium]HPI83021.1 helix-hairpin-helix domain-containing protein [Caldisericia bacterium]HPQ92248.1 helix-hairpin-helix domain-containing protein [Caldisericia bacterium]HRV74654.1 helix-hairpin-helix domain-containing protein [Caldisericia bacterium]